MQPISETFSLWQKYQNTKFQFFHPQSLSFSILEASNQAHTCDTGSYEVEWRTLRSLCVGLRYETRSSAIAKTARSRY